MERDQEETMQDLELSDNDFEQLEEVLEQAPEPKEELAEILKEEPKPEPKPEPKKQAPKPKQFFTFEELCPRIVKGWKPHWLPGLEAYAKSLGFGKRLPEAQCRALCKRYGFELKK